MSTDKKIYALIISAILLKVVLLLLLKVEPTTFENTAIAKNFISSGEMYYILDGNVDYNHQFPLFGGVLIVFFKIFGETLMPVLLFQILLNGLFALIVLKIWRLPLIDAPKKNWMDYALVSIALFHPLLSFYQLVTVHPLTVDVFLFALLTLLSFQWKENPDLKFSLLFSLVIGLAVLERATLIVAIAPLGFALSKDRKQLFKLVGITAISIATFLSPWMLRNQNRSGHFQMTSGTWRYMWVGIQEETNGTNVLANGESYYALFPDDVKHSWSSRTLDEQLEFYKSDYLNTWNSRPSHVLKMWVVKLKNYFLFSNRFGGGHDLGLPLAFSAYKFLHFILLIFVLVGLFSSYKRTVLLILIGGISLALIQSFFYVETRHALPMHFTLWIAAVLGVDFFSKKLMDRVK